jgi:hypothetical protein
MIMLIGSLILCFVILDFSLIGFLPKVLKIWPSLSDLISKDEILLKLEYHTFETNIKGQFMDSKFEKRYQYKPTLLTREFFIVRNTHFTYVFSVPTKSINGFKIKKSIGRKMLILNLTLADKERYIKIWPININGWVGGLSKLGCEQHQ